MHLQLHIIKQSKKIPYSISGELVASAECLTEEGIRLCR
jgi:hypothetical protein